MSSKLMKREEQNLRDTWAIEDLYANDELWQADKRKMEEEIEAFSSYQGRLNEGADLLLQMLDAYSKMNEAFEKLYVYANQRLHENTGNSKYQQLAGDAQTLGTKVESAAAFMAPEILALSNECLERYFEEEEGLSLYKKFIHDIVRQKGHILNMQEEKILAEVSEIADAPSNIYSMFNNADVKFSDITDEDGKQIQVTQGRFLPLLKNESRRVRKAAFQSVYAAYQSYRNTLAAAFNGNVCQSVFFAKIRKYPSSMAAALDHSEIPIKVYQNLIDTVHNNMSLMYRYVDLRKKFLGLKELHMYDLHVPMVEKVSGEISYEEAKKIVLKGLGSLGEDYQRLLTEGFENRWIDVFENEGKRTGAYSWGAYGTHPYVLLNYQGDLNNVFTLAHEMGHALHSYYSDENQPYLYAGYRIFVAEVASTCNEALLISHLIENTKDKKERAYLINYFLDQFKNTLFRQTMFAEFEMMVHAMAEQGKTLNADILGKTYYELNRKYFGEGVILDEEIAFEWARIPHFYTPFYVYQYATGFSAAIAISKKIRNGEEGITEKYKQFLSGGSSMNPIELLKLCDVDMTSQAPVEEALKVFGEYLDNMEALF